MTATLRNSYVAGVAAKLAESFPMYRGLPGKEIGIPDRRDDDGLLDAPLTTAGTRKPRGSSTTRNAAQMEHEVELGERLAKQSEELQQRGTVGGRRRPRKKGFDWKVKVEGGTGRATKFNPKKDWPKLEDVYPLKKKY